MQPMFVRSVAAPRKRRRSFASQLKISNLIFEILILEQACLPARQGLTIFDFRT
jgi:hypothetical protein